MRTPLPSDAGADPIVAASGRCGRVTCVRWGAGFAARALWCARRTDERLTVADRRVARGCAGVAVAAGGWDGTVIGAVRTGGVTVCGAGVVCCGVVRVGGLAGFLGVAPGAGSGLGLFPGAGSGTGSLPAASAGAAPRSAQTSVTTAAAGPLRRAARRRRAGPFAATTAVLTTPSAGVSRRPRMGSPSNVASSLAFVNPVKLVPPNAGVTLHQKFL
jgi:hypothetical protein